MSDVDEVQRRRMRVAEVMHSTVMDGGTFSAGMGPDLAAYIEGTITVEEGLARALARATGQARSSTCGGA